MGISIVGVGFQGPSKTAPWVEQEGFQYEIWTDSNKTLAETYDSEFSSGQGFANRVTVVLDANGTVLLEYPSSMTSNIGAHPQQVLEDCQKVFSQ
mgnify:CR=1 FL=1